MALGSELNESIWLFLGVGFLTTQQRRDTKLTISWTQEYRINHPYFHFIILCKKCVLSTSVHEYFVCTCKLAVRKTGFIAHKIQADRGFKDTANYKSLPQDGARLFLLHPH